MRDADKLLPAILGPLRPTRHPLALSRFGLLGLRSAEGLAKRFDGPRARALIAGNAAHSMLPSTPRRRRRSRSCSMLTGHAVGWPVARGGSQAVADALASIARSLGGGDRHRPPRRARSTSSTTPASVLFDLTPRQIVAIAGHRLPDRYRRRARALPLRARRLQARLGARRPDPVDGAGVRAAPAPCTSAARSRRSPPSEAVASGGSERPFVLLSQPRSATRAARRRASTSAGPTAMCRPARRGT